MKKPLICPPGYLIYSLPVEGWFWKNDGEKVGPYDTLEQASASACEHARIERARRRAETKKPATR